MFKRLVSVLLVSFMIFASFSVISYADETASLEIDAKSAILMEANTMTVLYEYNADEKLPPASVTKVMTLLLVMEAVDSGKIALDDMVTVGENAASMGGSQIYLEVGEQMSVNDLIKSVVVASANDAAAALAEFVCGSQESFVERMNERAEELGMVNTHFENTNGLDDTTTEHLTTARDIAIMSAELLKHEKILDYTTIWQDTVRNGEFTLTNTNRMLRFYSGCNGLKTGYTSKSGFCISATAKRDGMQLIAVVMGSTTSNTRNTTAKKLLDYGFAQYSYYSSPDEYTSDIVIKGASVNSVTLGADSIGKVLPKGQASKVSIVTELPEYLSAPVSKGDVVGSVNYVCDGEIIGKSDIYVTEDVGRITFGEIFIRILKNYLLF